MPSYQSAHFWFQNPNMGRLIWRPEDPNNPNSGFYIANTASNREENFSKTQLQAILAKAKKGKEDNVKEIINRVRLIEQEGNHFLRISLVNLQALGAQVVTEQPVHFMSSTPIPSLNLPSQPQPPVVSQTVALPSNFNRFNQGSFFSSPQQLVTPSPSIIPMVPAAPTQSLPSVFPLGQRNSFLNASANTPTQSISNFMNKGMQSENVRVNKSYVHPVFLDMPGQIPNPINFKDRPIVENEVELREIYLDVEPSNRGQDENLNKPPKDFPQKIGKLHDQYLEDGTIIALDINGLPTKWIYKSLNNTVILRIDINLNEEKIKTYINTVIGMLTAKIKEKLPNAIVDCHTKEVTELIISQECYKIILKPNYDIYSNEPFTDNMRGDPITFYLDVFEHLFSKEECIVVKQETISTTTNTETDSVEPPAKIARFEDDNSVYVSTSDIRQWGITGQEKLPASPPLPSLQMTYESKEAYRLQKEFEENDDNNDEVDTHVKNSFRPGR